MPTSPKRLTSSNASSMGGISAFTAKFMCHFGMNASTILNCTASLSPRYCKELTIAERTLPLHIRPFPRGSRERSSVNALNCKSMPGLPCAHCILPLTNQTGKKTIPCRTRIDSSPYAHLSPSWQMENCPLMRRLTGRPDRMITVKKGQKKQTTKTINESTCERRSACYLVIKIIMILMSLSIFHYDVCFHPCILQ